MHRPFIVLLAAVVPVAACASSGGSRSAGSSPDVLTAEDLRDWQGRPLGQALQTLRPEWLRSRGTSSFVEKVTPKVVVDRRVLGALEQLGNVAVVDVAEIRFLNSREATLRYGTDFSGGALVITTRLR